MTYLRTALKRTETIGIIRKYSENFTAIMTELWHYFDDYRNSLYFYKINFSILMV